MMVGYDDPDMTEDPELLKKTKAYCTSSWGKCNRAYSAVLCSGCPYSSVYVLTGISEALLGVRLPTLYEIYYGG